MKSKNPRHNSVRIVRRDYCFSGTCLENVVHWKTLLSSNAKTTYYSSKTCFFVNFQKIQNFENVFTTE